VRIKALISDLSKNPFDPKLNYEVAKEYHSIGQLASAISFYLRTAEYGEEKTPEYAYFGLINAALCFETQSNREATVENLLLKAIAHMPSNPNAYFYLSRFYERKGRWQECYTFASIGLSIDEKESSCNSDELFDKDYSWKYIEFEKAVSAWWIGRKNESISIFKSLLEFDLPQEYIDAIKSNLERIQ
jgi:hypothetical protein